MFVSPRRAISSSRPYTDAGDYLHPDTGYCRVASMNRSLLKDQKRLQDELKALQDKLSASRLGTLVRPVFDVIQHVISIANWDLQDKAVSSLKQMLASPKKESKTFPLPQGDSGLSRSELPIDQVIPHSPKGPSFDIEGRPPAETRFPSGHWDPRFSKAKFHLDPANDPVGCITLSPSGATVTTDKLGAQLVPGQRVWGVGPTMEFLVLPGDDNVPVVYDCRYNRQVSNELALRFKEVRNSADAEFRQAVEGGHI